MLELGQFGAKPADRAAVSHDPGAIDDHDADEGKDPVVRAAPALLPALRHGARPIHAAGDDRVQKIVLVLKW